MRFSKQECWSELPRPPPGNASLAFPALQADSLQLSTGDAHTYHTVRYISRAYLLLIVSLYPLKILFCPQGPNPWWPPFYSVFVCVAFLDSIYECCSTTGRCYLTLVRKGSGQDKKKTSVYKNVEQREPLCTIAENVTWCSHCWKECGGSSKN